MADPLYKQMTAFLVSEGIGDLSHTGKTYMGHLLAVHRSLEEQGCCLDVCRAGLFHSIYGTELFRRFSLPLERRHDVRAVIGERAERIAFANCLMDRSTFDALLESDGPYRLRNRETGETIELSRADYDDLVRVHLCDWLEQVARSGLWDYRREAMRHMAERLGGVALESYERVFALAPAASSA